MAHVRSAGPIGIKAVRRCEVRIERGDVGNEEFWETYRQTTSVVSKICEAGLQRCGRRGCRDWGVPQEPTGPSA